MTTFGVLRLQPRSKMGVTNEDFMLNCTLYLVWTFISSCVHVNEFIYLKNNEYTQFQWILHQYLHDIKPTITFFLFLNNCCHDNRFKFKKYMGLPCKQNQVVLKIPCKIRSNNSFFMWENERTHLHVIKVGGVIQHGFESIWYILNAMNEQIHDITNSNKWYHMTSGYPVD